MQAGAQIDDAEEPMPIAPSRERAPKAWRRPWNAAARVLRRLLTERTTPARMGWAVALGILVGCSPFIGLHLMIVIVLATLLGLNRAVTYLAANISVPWMEPFLLFASLQIGTFILHGHWLALSMESIHDVAAVQFGETWLLGSFVLGILIGAPAGLVTFTVAHFYRKRHPLPPDPIGDAMAGVVQRYATEGRFARGYIEGKLLHDPVYRQLAEAAPLQGPVVDLGCGRGQTGLLLHALQPGLEILGLDWDSRKLERARRVSEGGAGLRYELADVRGTSLPRAGTILIIDVLHYNSLQEQDAMLRAAAAALLPGGRLFVRDVDDGAGWRARLTRWQEKLGCAIRFNRGQTLVFRSAQSVVAVLQAAGLHARVTPSWEGTPLANVLITADR